MRKLEAGFVVATLTTALATTATAQNDDDRTFDARGIPPAPLPEVPVVFDTAEG